MNPYEGVTHIHCIGIKGIGLSALAQILAGRGFRVTGSDVSDTFPADAALKRAGIHIFNDLETPNLPQTCDLVIVSQAYVPTASSPLLHPKLREAKRRGIPVITYPEAVAPLFHAAQKSIAVSGTHGKSTTSAMLAVTLEHLGRDVDAIVGAVVKNWKSNAHLASRRGRSRAIFVLEADEYRHAFLHYEPSGAIVTSVEWDHPDAFPTSVSYVRAFRTFVQNIREGGFLVLSGDDRVARRLADDMSSSVRVMSYGFREENTVRISTFAQRSFGIEFSLKFGRRDLGLFRVGLYGRHHAYNAAAVVAAALALGEKPSAIRRALAAFRGTVRRFDVRCRRPLIVDDYAHHPSEIVATIEAARAAFPGRRVRVLFQPHTYTRTAALFDDFVSALRGADECTILKTYSSARETLASLRGRKEMKRATSEELASALRARHVANPSLAIRLYEKTLKEDDVLLVVGAGIGNIVAEELSRRRCCDRRNDG